LKKSVKRLLVAALITSVLALTIKSGPVKAPIGGTRWIVPSPTWPTLAIAVAMAGPNDEIHVLNGYAEVLGANLVIPQANLWMIGAPPSGGSVPTIDLAGFSIIVTGFRVFIWGLNIIDSVGSPVGIQLVPPSSDCTIMHNTITGLIPASTGIQALTPNNIIVLNDMTTLGTCIDLAGPACVNNVVKGNTLSPPYITGIQVSGGAGFNKVYWNNLMLPLELNDANPPGSPPNWFDDTTGGGPPGLMKGNFEITWAIPFPPFPVPGPNGYVDNWPRVVPWTQLACDVNVDGRVNLPDLVLLANSYGTQWCDLLWDPRCDLAAPLGRISLTDLVVLAKNWGNSDP
jgi:hypothetical protein